MSPKVKKNGFIAPDKGVVVRMYNSGFGDCFLLTFRSSDGNPRYMLIDFGMHSGNKDRICAIAEDIGNTTGWHLHLVAISHEHTDHINGISIGREIFDKFQIDRLWLAWGDDPNDSLAKRLKNELGKNKKTLKAALNLLENANSSMAIALRSVFEFEPESGLSANRKGGLSEIDYLKKKSKFKLVRSSDFLRPGEIREIPDVPGVKAYVLGPPRDENAIKKMESSGEEYFAFSPKENNFAFNSAINARTRTKESDEYAQFRRSRPFDATFEISKESARKDSVYRDFFRKYYGFDDTVDEGPAWRRIEYDWLEIADELALWIAKYTNNVSLAFAIELDIDSKKKILLFVGDAQLGNWLSWQKLKWKKASGGAINVKDIFQETVLYKVGHHGSHNATPRENGLELMGNDELVAMIPVDEKYKRIKGEHPSKAILKRLITKTRGRVFRSDQIPKNKENLAKPDGMSDVEWQEYLKKIEIDENGNLWIEYIVN